MQITITIDDTDAWAVAEARAEYNKGQPATITQLKDVVIQTSAPAVDGVAPLVLETVTRQQYVEEPNPDLVETDEGYVQLVTKNLVAQWAGAFSSRVRVPTGTWMQRWTVAERKAIRAMGLQNAQVEAWLDQLDASEYVNLTHPSVITGVAAVCHSLQEAGLVADASARAVEILARPGA